MKTKHPLPSIQGHVEYMTDDEIKIKSIEDGLTQLKKIDKNHPMYEHNLRDLEFKLRYYKSKIELDKLVNTKDTLSI